jgi:hypothetical protein
LIVDNPEASMRPGKLRALWRGRNLMGVLFAILLIPLGVFLCMAPFIKDLADESLFRRGLFFLLGAGILAAYGAFLRRAFFHPLLKLARHPARARAVQGRVLSEALDFNDFGSGRHAVIRGEFEDGHGQLHAFEEPLTRRLWSRVYPQTSLSSKFFVAGSAAPVDPAVPAWILYDAEDPTLSSFLGFPAEYCEAKGIRAGKGLRLFTVLIWGIALYVVLSVACGLIF